MKPETAKKLGKMLKNIKFCDVASPDVIPRGMKQKKLKNVKFEDDFTGAVTFEEAELQFVTTGSYPLIFQAGEGGSCPANSHSVTNAKGTKFCRRNRGKASETKGALGQARRAENKQRLEARKAKQAAPAQQKPVQKKSGKEKRQIAEVEKRLAAPEGSPESRGMKSEPAQQKPVQKQPDKKQGLLKRTAKKIFGKKSVKMSESNEVIFKMQENILLRSKELKLSENQIKALTDDMKQDKSGV